MPALLPTPTARDWKSGASNLHGVNSRPLGEVAVLFKTPTANLGRNGSAQSPDKRRAGGHGPTLDDEVTYLLTEPSVTQDWGCFEPAIRQHERLTGRPAPLPTETGPRGGRRLSAPFAEWLMGLPDGWVTGVPGLTRSQQLQAIGNGVVPQQAEAAFRYLMTDWPERPNRKETVMDEEAIRQENEARLAELRRQTDAAIEAARKALEQAGGGGE